MTYDHWNLKDRVPTVRCFSSGPVQEWTIRILWSNKLGLEYQIDIKNQDEAENIRLAIENYGRIQTHKWRKVYYPGKHWLDSYAD